MQKHNNFLTRNHFFKIAFAVSSSLVLTSCATVSVMERLDYSPPKILISDSLIAYGYAKNPIPQLENALIVVGKQYNYLIEADQQEGNNNILKDTVTQLDLKALSITPAGISRTGDFRIHQKDQKDGFHETLAINFNKALPEVSTAEKQRLEQLNFNCFANTATQSYDCSRRVEYTLSPIKKTNQDSQLQHTFKSPIQLELSTDRSAAVNAVSKAPYVLLLPITTVVDVVTLPIQYALFMKAFSHGHH